MSTEVSPYVAFGVWALVAVTGSIVSSVILMVLSWTSEASKAARPRGLKSLPPVRIHSCEGRATTESNSTTEAASEKQGDEDDTPTAVLTQTAPDNRELTPEPRDDEALETTTQATPHIPQDNGFLLPPRIPGDPRRLTVILDLDETLVRSCEAENVPMQLEFAASVGLLNRVEIVCGDPRGGPPEKIMSFLRPGVIQFLNQLSTFAEVVVFTAGDPEYASPLVAYLDQDGKNVASSLYRDATVRTVFHDHVKDLSRLGRDPRYTVLVDNNPFSFLFQPDNGVLCEPFYGDPSDQYLTQELIPMLKLLACVQDVRPILRRRYNLVGWRNSLPWQQLAALRQQETL